MSQKKASGPSAKKTTPTAAKPDPAGTPGGQPKEPKIVAFDRQRLESFVMGYITMGEMEGIGKEVQYEMAQKGYRVLSEGKLNLAKDIFRGLLALDPYDSYFHTAYGATLQREGKYADAENAYSLALKFNPYNTTALANRGESRFQLGKVLEAAQDIKEAVRLDPNGKDPATLRARVLSMAIAGVIKENQQAIMDELEKAKKSAKAGSVGKPSKTAAKPAPAKPAVAPKKK